MTESRQSRQSRRPFSLRRRLLLILLVTMVSAWLIALLCSYRDADREVNTLLDAHLAQSAALLAAHIGEEFAEMEQTEAMEELHTDQMPYLRAYTRQVVFQIWGQGQILLLHSANAPVNRLSAQGEGFSATLHQGERWRVFSTWDNHRRFLIQVGERQAVRDRIVGSIAEHLLQPMLIALPLLALLIWFGVARGLRPLTALSVQVSNRDPANLAPLANGRAPAEVEPLIASLNRLFARMRVSLAHERRFTADAAHELRTPLAAIKTQAQVAEAAANVAEQRRALSRVVAGCDRAAHLVDQLLTLARLEPDRTAGGWQSCELAAVAATAIAELAPAGLAKNIELELHAVAPAPIVGDPGLLGILLRNLLDNAIRYSPAGTVVRVEVEGRAAGATLAVVDQGPGLAPAEREKVLQRFYRVLGSGETGSGLGLSIVSRIAELHGARLVLAAGECGRGLRVTVNFPVAAP